MPKSPIDLAAIERVKAAINSQLPKLDVGISGPLNSKLAFPPLGIVVISDINMTEKVLRIRKKRRTFWEALWASLFDLDQGSYTPVEYFEFDKPMMFYDSMNSRVICHPSLVAKIKRQVVDGHSFL